MALTTAAGGMTPQLESSIEKMNALNAWHVDAEAKRVLEAVGVRDPNMLLENLSGAWAGRCGGWVWVGEMCGIITRTLSKEFNS